MSAKKNILFGTMFCLAAAAAALSPLPSGKAPFKQDRDKGRIYSGDAALDREKLTWNYGSKQLKFNLDGSFQILSNGRELGNTCFSIATPHGQWQTNRGAGSDSN